MITHKTILKFVVDNIAPILSLILIYSLIFYLSTTLAILIATFLIFTISYMIYHENKKYKYRQKILHKNETNITINKENNEDVIITINDLYI